MGPGQPTRAAPASASRRTFDRESLGLIGIVNDLVGLLSSKPTLESNTRLTALARKVLAVLASTVFDGAVRKAAVLPEVLNIEVDHAHPSACVDQ
jgi:hypothetical protein